MANIFRLDRKSVKQRREAARKLREYNALPTAKEGSRIGRKRGRIIPPKYDLTRRTEE